MTFLVTWIDARGHGHADRVYANDAEAARAQFSGRDDVQRIVAVEVDDPDRDY